MKHLDYAKSHISHAPTRNLVRAWTRPVLKSIGAEVGDEATAESYFFCFNTERRNKNFDKLFPDHRATFVHDNI